VSELFTGTHDHRIDGKGRVSLPSDFRRVLNAVNSSDSLYIVPTLNNRRAHVLLPLDAYASLIKRHNTREYETTRERDRAALKLIHRARKIQVDDTGRIVIPQSLREKIGLSGEVVFVGDESTFQIWPPAARAEYEIEMDPESADDPMDFDLRGLS